MTFGAEAVNALRRALVALIIVAIPAGGLGAEAVSDRPAGGGIDGLMLGLAQVKSARGRFVERKYLRILSEPIESSGTLLYRAPDRIEKEVVRPRTERMVVDGDKLTIDRGTDGGARTLSLAEYPHIQAIVEGIRATLAGDLLTIRRFYEVDYRGDAAAWLLILQPREQKLRNLVASIRIAGTGNAIRTVETIEGDGDRSMMSVEEDTR